MKKTFATRYDHLVHSVRSGENPGFTVTILELLLANIYNLFPGLSLTEMHDLAKRLFVMQKRSILELQHLSEMMPGLDIVNNSGVKLDAPAIYCAYHYGAYRLIAPALMTQGCRLTIVMDKMVALEQEADFSMALLAHASEYGLPTDSFAFRDTSDGGLMRGMLRDLKQGRSLLLYLDGNTGTGKVGKKEEHSHAVPFMGHTLASRIGIPVLSQMAKVPIICVRNLRSDERPLENRMEFLPAIQPGTLSREQYIDLALRKMWGVIEEQARADPQHWESLRYINKYVRFAPHTAADPAERIVPGETRPLYFNRRRFSVRTDLPEEMLFDRQRMLLYRIDGQLRNLLRDVQHDAIGDLSVLDPSVVDWMNSKGFLATHPDL